MKTTLIFSLLLLLIAAAARAQQYTQPGWFRSEFTPEAITNEQSRATQGEEDGGQGGQSSLLSLPEIAEAITPEIQALARGLENDPKRIFDYVHDHIRYVHYFGSKKGAQLTLLERSGNDFDQCALLVALLRAAGHNASYRWGRVWMPYEDWTEWDFKHWLGLSWSSTNVAATLSFAHALNDSRGFPYSNDFGDGTDDLVFHRVWVKLVRNGTNYWLDPAFKINDPVDGVDLGAAMQLSTNALMSAAAGSDTTDYTQNLNESSLRNKLREFTTNFLSDLQDNYPNASVQDVIGGQSIRSSMGQPLNTNWSGLAFYVLTNSTLEWDYIPTDFMTTLNVRVDGTNRLLFMPELQGNRLSLTFNSNGLAQLWLEDQTILEKQTSGGDSVEMVLSVNHPHGQWNFTNNTLINQGWSDHIATNTYQRTNASYALMYAFEPEPGWLRQRQERLDVYRQQGLPDNSRQVVTETLNVMGLDWLVQTGLMMRSLAQDQQLLLQYHHRLGRMAQEAGKGYYIDVYQQLNGLEPASGYGTNDLARSDRFFNWGAYLASAAEHGLIEQQQATGLTAASTIKMLQVANANGQKVFLAKNNNWTTGSNVRSQLTGYSTNTLNSFGNSITAGARILLPQHGTNTVAGAGTWAGYGAVLRYANSIEMAISGKYNGGFVSDPTATVDPAVAALIAYLQADRSDLVPVTTGGDPVDMANGAFRISTTDLSLGQGEPRGLTFSRHYSPTRRYRNVANLAHGWVHNYHFNAAEVSDPLPSLGTTTPAQMAPLLVAAKAAYELYQTNGSPKNWMVTALIAKWGVDHLVTNAVSLTLGDSALQFVRQPDGRFTPPAGSTHTLLKTNGAYWLKERHGNTFKFHTDGRLNNIVDRYDKSLTVGYDASNRVQTVTDWKNRTLTFAYSGTPQRLASITDSTGRTVNYGYGTSYSAQGDLVSVTDPAQQTSTFIYDTNHLVLATKDALGRVVTTNIFDAFARVIEQHSEGDTNKTWRFYWSGFVNTEEDPAGSRRRFFYDDKQRLIITQDALGRYTDAFYDGQDHVVQTVSHLLEVTDYTYDGRHNLTAINDPLGAQVDYYYDSQDRLERVWDKRGFNTYFGYNSKHQLTLSTNDAGDWLAFDYHATEGTLSSRADSAGTTTYGYDAWGQLGGITYPGGLGGEGFLNNALGDVLTHTNARQFATSFQYSPRRELTNTIAPTNLTAHVVFDAVGNVTNTVDPRGAITTNHHSATRKLLRVQLPGLPAGAPVLTNTYDARDWLLVARNPLQQKTEFGYDRAQQLVSLGDALNRTNRFAYDGVGRRTHSINAAGETNRQFWSQRGEQLRWSDAMGSNVLYAYDPAGNQTLLSNRNQKFWQFQYDPANRLTNTLTPLLRRTATHYNNRGLVGKIVEPSNQETTLAYDARGRLQTRTDGVATNTTYVYDGNDNLLSLHEAGRSNVWTYDAYDRIGSYRDTEGNLIQYRYDANGNLTNLVYPGGKTVTNVYDSHNRLTNVKDWAGRETIIEYDLAGRVTRIIRPNGTVRQIGYDAAGQTTNIFERSGTGGGIAYFKFNWNNAERVEWEFSAPKPQPWTPPTRTMTYDDDNRLATFKLGSGSTQTVTHDTDGNMTSGPLTNDTLVAHTYDARDRLLAVGGLQYSYDALGNRISVSNAAGVTKFVINPNAALSQTLMRVRGGVTNYYIHGVGLLYEVTETATSTNTLTYHYDYRGSTVALTRGNGTISDRVEYSPYGSITYRAGTNDVPFLYNGRYGVQTDRNGLLFMRARYYNPYLCRFLTEDPAGFSAGLNFFAAFDGNPVSMMDPFGLGAVGESSSSWLITPSSLSGWVADQGIDALLGTASLASRLIGGGLENFLGLNAGHMFAQADAMEANMSPYGRAGYYDTQNPVTQNATIVAGVITKKPTGGSTRGVVNVTSKGRTVGQALTTAHKWLGPGYKEIGKPGSGVYRSADGLRQFRMTAGDIAGSHGKIGPHVQFQKFDATGKELKNIHTPLLDR